MSDSESEQKRVKLEPELRDMRIQEASPGDVEGGHLRTSQMKADDRPGRTPTPITIPSRSNSQSTSRSPIKQPSAKASPSAGEEHEKVVGGDITLKIEPGKGPKLARAASQKVLSKPPPIYLDLPDSTEDAKKTFGVLPECTYASKYLGITEHALECDCSEEWDSEAGINLACGEDSDCINRATKMECIEDCGCGNACQNQRFLRKQYADVTVIKTDKKGYGLRANTNLRPGDFIFEYIGEVINEQIFRRRMIQYDEEGIKHFYFMSLTKGEFVDATKKGNLGRFCNYSCNPNCYVDKWVVGDRLRMGIFAERKIKAGEELVFNYNVDRYGADPQPCYCGEPNCTGYIGGKTQTDNATKLSHGTIEALGIDDGDGWDTAVAKKPRKKKASEDDEEYVNNIQPKSLEESGVQKVMAALRQCTEKWVAVKLLSRIESADDERVGHRVIRMHGYLILKMTLTAWISDANIVLQVLEILHKLPRITRNKIQDSGIEETIEKLKSFDDERVQTKATELQEAWSKLVVAYRIPRVKRDPNAGTPIRREAHFERREKGRERSRTRSKSPSIDAPKGPSAIPSGPRGFNAPRHPGAFSRPPFRPRPPFGALPQGWYQTVTEQGRTYYYNSAGETKWDRPTQPTAQASLPPSSKAKSNEQKLQDIISNITQNATPTNPPSASATPGPADDVSQDKKSKSEKWKSLPQDKQEKLYEVTLQPHVMSVAASYRKKLEKDDLKRLSKEVAKKLVRGDYKHGKVKDPTAKLDSKHSKTVKKFVKEFLDKAVQKKEAKEKEKAAKQERREQSKLLGKGRAESTIPKPSPKSQHAESDDEMFAFSDNEGTESNQISPTDSSNAELKRKREEEGELGSPKKSRMDVVPPPPPPPPPEDEFEMDGSNFTSLEYADSDPSSAFQDSPSAEHFIPSHLKQGNESPMQLATPPTTTNGSCEHDSNGGHEQEPRIANNAHSMTVNGCD